MLLLPGGGGDGAVGVHDDLGTAYDHGHQEQTEEGDATQSQTLVHVHEGRVRSGLRLHRCSLSESSAARTHATTILRGDLREREGQGRTGRSVSTEEENEGEAKREGTQMKLEGMETKRKRRSKVL